jgi:hypothetical protein
MKLLISDIEELKKHVAVQHTDHGFRNVAPYLEMAQRMYLRQVLGKELLAELLALAASEGESGSGSGSGGGSACATVKDETLQKARQASAWLALYEGFSALELNISLDGITQAMKDRDPIYSGQRTDVKMDLLKHGMNAVEDLLEHLEENKACHADWATSDARTDMVGHILPTAKMFTQYWGSMADKRLTYMALRAKMIDVEENQVQAILGETLYAELMGQLTGTVSANNAKLLRFLRPFVAKMTAAKAMPQLQLHIEAYGVFSWLTEKNEKNSQVLSAPKGHVVHTLSEQLKAEADQHRTDLVKYLQAKVATYPLFKDSEMYVAPVVATETTRTGSGGTSCGGVRGFF